MPPTYTNSKGEVKSFDEHMEDARREAIDSGADIRSEDVIVQRTTAAQLAARQRGYRGGCLKRLQKHFKMYQSFDVTLAAELTGIEAEDLQIYLAREAGSPGTRIVFVGDGLYQIVSRFL